VSQPVTFGLVEKAHLPDHQPVGGGGQADPLSSGNVSLMNCQVNGAALSPGLQQTGLEMLAFRSSGFVVFHQRSVAIASRSDRTMAAILPKRGRRFGPWLGGIAERARLDRGQMA
jgi:hypothetical protein